MSDPKAAATTEEDRMPPVKRASFSVPGTVEQERARADELLASLVPSADPEPQESIFSSDERIRRLEEAVEEQALLILRLAKRKSRRSHQSRAPAAVSDDAVAIAIAAADDAEPSAWGASLCSRMVEFSLAPPTDDVVGGLPMSVVSLLRRTVNDDEAVGSFWSDLQATASLILPYLVFACQLMLLGIVSEAGTSRACTPESQEGCHRGMYCSLQFANGQCYDCHQVLAQPFNSAFQRNCPSNYPFNYTPFDTTLPVPYNQSERTRTRQVEWKRSTALTSNAHSALWAVTNPHSSLPPPLQ